MPDISEPVYATPADGIITPIVESRHITRFNAASFTIVRKAIDETETCWVDMRGALVDGEVIEAAVVSSSNPALVILGATYTNSFVEILLTGGVSGVRHAVKVIIATSNDNTREANFIVAPGALPTGTTEANLLSTTAGYSAAAIASADLAYQMKLATEAAAASGDLLFHTYSPDKTGVASSVTKFKSAASEAGSLVRTLRIPAGIYLQDADIDIVGIPNLTIEFAPGCIILNTGRTRMKNDGETPFVLPWSMEFNDCPGLKLLGWPTFKTVGAAGGSSSGAFNYTNYLLRRPVLSLVDSPNWHLQVKHEGDPGLGMFNADRDAIIATLSLTPTPIEFEYFAGRSMFFCAYNSPNGFHDRCELVPDTCSREQFGFIGSNSVRSFRPRSVSEGQNFPSLAKIIWCNSFRMEDPQIKDTSFGSLLDVIGDDFVFQGGSLIEYPAGKICDVSHEHTGGNGPTRRSVFRDIRTTGTGVVNAAGSSSTEEIEDNPISDMLVDNCRFNIGREDFSSAVSANIPRVISAKYNNMAYINESPVGYTWTNDGGELIEVSNSSLTWTKPSGSLATNNRSMIARVLNRYINCDIRANSSLAGSGGGLASLPFSGQSVGGRHEFRGGSIKDTAISITGGAELRLYGVNLENFSYTAPDGTIAFFGCTLNGVPTDSLTPEMSSLLARYTPPAPRNAVLSMDAFLRDLAEMGAAPYIERIAVAVADARQNAFVDLYDAAATLGDFDLTTFIVNGGMHGDGTATSVVGNFNFSTATKFAQNSAYVGIWGGGAGAAYPNPLFGSSGSGNTYITTRDGSDQAVLYLNSAAPLTVSGITDSRGYLSACRTSSTLLTARKNGAVIGTETTASAAPTSTVERIGRRNTAYSSQIWLLRIIGSGELGALDSQIYASARRLLIARGMDV